MNIAVPNYQQRGGDAKKKMNVNQCKDIYFCFVLDPKKVNSNKFCMNFFKNVRHSILFL